MTARRHSAFRWGLLSIALVMASCSDSDSSGDASSGSNPDVAEETAPDQSADSTSASSEDSGTATGSADQEISESNSSVDAESEQPTSGGDLNVGLMIENTGWLAGPHFILPPSGYSIMHSIFDPLLSYNDDGQLIGFLAETVDLSDDALQMTLTLRDGVVHQDGTELTAAEVKNWFDTIMKGPDSRLAPLLGAVASLEAVDDLTLVVNLVEPFPALADLFTQFPGMPFSTTAAEQFGEDAANNPTGTGAFRFVSWLRDSELVVERNDDYWREGFPFLDKITYKVIPDEDARIASLLSGEVDIIETLSFESSARLLDEEGIVVESKATNNVASVIFNTASAPLDDLRVRKALVQAIDTEAVIAATGGAGITSSPRAFYPEGSRWYSPEAAAAYPQFDLEAAQALIDEYISDPERSDGKDVGEPISFSYQTGSDATAAAEGVLLQSMWSELGADVEILQFDPATLDANARGEEPDFDGNFDVMSAELGSDFDPDTAFPNLYGPLTLPTNVFNFTSPELQELISAGKSGVTYEERKHAYGELQLILAEELPAAYLYSTVATVAFREGVHGTSDWVNPDGTAGTGHPNAIMRYWNVWLDPES